ncbi:ComEC/Rec2 family competence protein [Cyanobium sp. NIES-981]|uniref:ComEC/Rec2 family competence protein n=1 Tax=Cyanobium sp. NIES-981 TaxID=1851505 RepID=UPI0007DDBB68|nr:ComEC/Rec2 family competence protein [Cyanobium sp. NIES-981]SBO43185.1 DNA internalization competence protein, ComEC/Rec2 family protein (modular protein) [Cyanobium sp. NIES-981]
MPATPVLQGSPPPGRGPWLRRLVWGALLALVVVRALWVVALPSPPAAADPVWSLNGRAGAPGAVVTLRGRALSDALPAGGGQCRALLQLPVGRTELRLPACEPLQEGWRLEARGRLRQPQPAPHPLLAGPAERLRRAGAATQLQVEELVVLSRPATPVADLRRALAQRLVAGAGSERGGVLAALVLGSARVPLPDTVRQAFRAAGLSHALAASGFHLSVLLGAVLPLGRRLPRWPRLALALGAMALFVLLAGPQPSVLRAVLMGGLALAVLECGQQGRPFGILMASALLLLLLQPAWLADVGFQLSVVATAALVVAAPPLEQALRRRLPRRCPAWLAASMAVPLAASLWTLPLQLFHFGVVPLYAVPANLLVAPLLTPLTLGAMALALLAVLLPGLLPLLLPPVAWLAGLVLAIVKAVAAWPLAQWQLGRPTPLLVLLLALGLLGLGLPRLARGWRRLALALLVLVALGHVALLRGDQLLLVHQGSRDLLLARHQGRAALVSAQADGLSCSQARQLATGFGVARFDWVLLLDPLPAAEPACWQAQAGLVLASEDGSPPLRQGQWLGSPGLVAEALSGDSRGVRLLVGSRRWLLLPDRQALWAWQQLAGEGSAPAGEGVWLGFPPRRAERRTLPAGNGQAVWLSGGQPGGGEAGAGDAVGGRLPPGWATTGASGSLQQGWG